MCKRSNNFQYIPISSLSSSQLLAVAHFFAEWPGTCLLYSGGKQETACLSYLALFPFETVSVAGQVLNYQLGHQKITHFVQDPWQGLQEYFFSSLNEDLSSFAFGWFGYQMGAFADLDHPLPYRSASTPDAYWQRCAFVLCFDHQTKQATLQLSSFAKEWVCEDAQHWLERFSTVEGWLEWVHTLPSQIDCPSCFFSKEKSLPPFPQKEAYLKKVEQAQEWIRAGEIYQVNLSQAFRFPPLLHPFLLFYQLNQQNPSPFSAYFRHEQFSIVSASPERFLSKRGQRLETRPIKGTIRRGKQAAEDDLLKAALLSSPKERAELLMITDLMRNDLSRISEIGSVETSEIWRCEAYANVYHLLSIIHSQAKKEFSSLEIIRSAFPGGSITGCPKLRAMEIIDRLEEDPRGIYTGSIGYITGKGDFDLNIAIRTCIGEKDFSSLHLGSGIVIDSDPLQEYQEILSKGASFFDQFSFKYT